jgi:hypothetical protein
MRHIDRLRIPLVLAAFAALFGCGGGGGDGGGGPPPATVTVSGRVTFDRVPFKPTVGEGLNPASPIERPARQVLVEVIDATSNAVLASTSTDANGEYSVSVPSNRNVFVRAKAQMLKTGGAPTWNFRVLNNTNGDALYALDSTSFNTGSSNVTRDLRATTGWGTINYAGTRAAAPFAILDTVYQAKELVLSASQVSFPALDLFWSPNNRSSSDFCPDNGNIVSSLYITFGDNQRDDCNAPGADGIYVLGDFAGGNGDTDEFDQHVIAHEFGHYLEDRFGRSDSIGGDHGFNERLDLRLAFGEGWGNAFSGMVLNDPVYRDSFQGVSRDGGFNIESDSTTVEGWFSESSISEILWDIFDPANEPGDTVALGFAPIFNVMTGAQTQTDAFASIFSFARALRAANPSESAAIATLLSNEAISGTDDFGAGESNDGDDATVLPVYRDITPNSMVNVCTTSQSGTGFIDNKLGNRKFLRLVLGASAIVTIQATGASPGLPSIAATDPDIYVYRRGSIVAVGDNFGSTETLSQLPLSAGTYIIEVHDYDADGVSNAPRCMNVSITGS